MKNYTATFDFTTVGKGGLFTGRNGAVDFSTDQSLEQVKANENEIEQLCLQAIYAKNSKWKVFMIKVKEINQLP